MALTLVLALDAIFLGVSNQLSRYIDDSGADVWVAQDGVRNLHMVASALPGKWAVAGRCRGRGQWGCVRERRKTLNCGGSGVASGLP